MRMRRIDLIFVGMVLANSLFGHATEDPAAERSEPRSKFTIPVARETGSAIKPVDTCGTKAIESNSASPMWDSPAQTTQCSLLETDNLISQQLLEQGALQQTIATTVRYGLTTNVEVRWGLPGRMMQRGGGTAKRAGTTDQWLGACWRFHDQSARMPDLALDYAVKIPTANPSKGFGSGYIDNQLTFIASRDLGLNHLDFNAVGTITGGPVGTDGAAQFGLAFTRKLTPKLLGTLEIFGGPQPGTSDRYGAWLLGGAWSIKPSLALNAAYSRAYTAGSPREQYLFGFIYTMRLRIGLPEASMASQ